MSDPKLSQLDEHAQTCRARLAQLASSRRDFVAAASNDTNAICKVMDADAEIVHLQQELTLLDEAITTRARALAEANAKQEQEAREQESCRAG